MIHLTYKRSSLGSHVLWTLVPYSVLTFSFYIGLYWIDSSKMALGWLIWWQRIIA